MFTGYNRFYGIARAAIMICFVVGAAITAFGERRGLVVGIDHYSPAYGAGSLPSCINDAKGFRSTVLLGDPAARWTAANVQIMTDSQATKTAIRTALQTMASQSVAGDVAVYFHSSHGGQTSGTSTFLCSYNANYTDTELGTDLAAFNTSASVIVVVDACHSGGLFKNSGWPFAENVMAGYRAEKAKRLAAAGEAVPKTLGANIGFMVACDYDEYSYAGSPYSQYAGALISACGLAGTDVNSDGELQFMEIHNYAATATASMQTAQHLNSTLLNNLVVRTAIGGSGDDSYEENDTLQTAFDLSGDEQTWLSAISGPGIQADQDWYQIEVTPGYEQVVVDCTFTDVSGDIDIALFDASGYLLADSAGMDDDEYIDYTVSGAGTYYIVVYYGNAGNNYDLWWDDQFVGGGDDAYEVNDTLGTAFDLSGDEQTWLSAISGLGIQANQDWYKIEVTPGYEYVVVDCTFTQASGDIDIALFDASGNWVTGSEGVANEEHINFTVPSAGTYYIEVYNGNAGNTYDLRWDDLIRPDPVYRFWSSRNKAHFYTISASEKDMIIRTMSRDWSFEGVAYYAYASATSVALPVYRFWSPTNRGHFFTISEAEKDNIIQTLSRSWRYEGVAYYAFDSAVSGSAPVYRFWSPRNRHHFFTISEPEKDNIIANLSRDWSYEGVAYYAFATTGIVPLSASPRLKGIATASLDASVGADRVGIEKGLAPTDTVGEMDATVVSTTSQAALNADGVVFPLSYPGREVTASVSDGLSEEQTSILNGVVSPTHATFAEVQEGRSYRFEVWVDDPESGELILSHRSWFERQLDAPDLLGEGDDAASSENDDGVGSPKARIKMPSVEGTMTVRLYSSSEGVVQTVEGAVGGETIELTLPKWNQWYWVSGRLDSDNEVVLSLWLRHEK